MGKNTNKRKMKPQLLKFCIYIGIQSAKYQGLSGDLHAPEGFRGCHDLCNSPLTVMRN